MRIYSHYALHVLLKQIEKLTIVTSEKKTNEKKIHYKVESNTSRPFQNEVTMDYSRGNISKTPGKGQKNALKCTLMLSSQILDKK